MHLPFAITIIRSRNKNRINCNWRIGNYLYTFFIKTRDFQDKSKQTYLLYLLYQAFHHVPSWQLLQRLKILYSMKLWQAAARFFRSFGFQAQNYYIPCRLYTYDIGITCCQRKPYICIFSRTKWRGTNDKHDSSRL